LGEKYFSYLPGTLSRSLAAAGVHSFMVSTIAELARWLKMDAEETSVLWLDGNAEQQAF
jgi:hypothetical protein